MYKTQKHIEIVRTPIKNLSSMSIGSAQILKKTLKRTYSKVGVTNITCLQDLENLALTKPDLVFLGMKKLVTAGEDIWISEFLDSHDIPYTGSAKIAHELELDKSLAKKRVLAAGLSTSDFLVIEPGSNLSEHDVKLPYPVFIKPIDRGGGVGIDDNSVANNFSQLQEKVRSIHSDYDASALIERYLGGREFSVAILREISSRDLLAMPLELIAPINSKGNRLLSSAVKSSDTEEFKAVENPELRQSLSDLATGAFHALGARDYGRIDIRLDDKGVPHFLEANLIPSILKDYGNFPKACMLNENINYEEAMLRIVDLAFERALENEPAHVAQPALFTHGNPGLTKTP